MRKKRRQVIVRVQKALKERSLKEERLKGNTEKLLKTTGSAESDDSVGTTEEEDWTDSESCNEDEWYSDDEWDTNPRDENHRDEYDLMVADETGRESEDLNNEGGESNLSSETSSGGEGQRTSDYLSSEREDEVLSSMDSGFETEDQDTQDQDTGVDQSTDHSSEGDFVSRHGAYCDNCMRQYVCAVMDPVYEIEFHEVSSHSISGNRSHLRQVLSTQVDNDMTLYLLCTECRNFLDTTLCLPKKVSNSWENTWPSFLWNLLTGRESCSGSWFVDVYSAEEVWKYIPDKIRPYWRGAFTRNGTVKIPPGCGVGRNRVRYDEFSRLAVPEDNVTGRTGITSLDTESYFHERSSDIQNFHKDVGKMDLQLLVKQLVPENDEDTPIILPDVLCPWGCTEFCFRAADIEYGIVVQHHLRKIQLNFPDTQWYKKLYLIETSRLDFIRSDYDVILLNEKWRIRPQTEIVKKKGLCVKLCRHHSSNNTRKRLYPHPPRKPDHNLSAEQGDQLSHAQVVGRIHKSVQASVFNTKMTMHTQEASFAGSSSANVSTTPRFSKGFTMLARHEALSMAGRPDISHLASRHVLEGTMMESLADCIRSDAERLYPDIDKYLHGATYVGLTDSMILHMNTKNSCVKAVVKRKRANGRVEEAAMNIQRSWSPLVNFLQTEDQEGYGSPFSPVPFYRGSKGTATMILWALTGAMAGCKEFHRSIDKKSKPFHHQDWAGHMMAHVHHHCAKHDDNYVPKGSPFRTSRSLPFLLEKVEKCMPHNFENDDSSLEHTSLEEMAVYYRHNYEYWKNLLPESDYETLSINRSVHEVMSGQNNFDSGKIDVIAIVGTEMPDEGVCQDPDSKPGEIKVGGKLYEARLILVLDQPDNPTENPSNYYGARYVRHGGGFDEWWVQERRYGGAQMTKKYCRETQSVFPKLREHALSYITLYVKMEQVTAEKYRLDFHKSLGGQAHVFCNCTEDPFPMIVSGRRKNEKKQCMTTDCTKTEHYICSHPGCESRVCKDCFDKQPQNRCTYLDPVAEEVDNQNAVDGNGLNSQNDIGGSDRSNRGHDQGYSGDHEDNYDEESQDDESDLDRYEDWGMDYDEMEVGDDDGLNNHSNNAGGLLPRVMEEDGLPELSNRYETDSESDPEDEFEMDYNSGIFEYEDYSDGDDVSFAHEEVLNHDESPPYRVHDTSLRDTILGMGDTSRDNVRRLANTHQHSRRRMGFNSSDTDENIGSTSRGMGFNGCVDAPLLQDFVTRSNLNPVDVPEEPLGGLSDKLPKTSAGDYAQTVLPKDGTGTVPCHVLFNQAGSLCTRYNKKIKGTQAQQNFVQRLVSTVQGMSIPLLWIMGTCFPRHFYASAKRDRCAILGCAPLSCYTGTMNPNGFASSLSIARNLGTHSSSSTSTCPLFWSFLYDIQANRVASEYDSRLIGRRGFTVDVKSNNGIALRDESNKSNLTENVDSHQSALDLAATQFYLKFHMFMTFTCNQAEHPGIKHLYNFKESMKWTKHIPEYEGMGPSNRRDVKRSYEAAYGSILGRCWMEVRKLWLEYITYSTTSILRRVTHVFFRDEYQEDSGNLSHIHGLIALYNEDMENEEFHEFVTGLQKSAVCDLFSTSEIDRYVSEGLFESPEDWKTLTAKAEKVLTHKCDKRCQKRVGDGDGPENFVCRKLHSVFAKTNPLVDEMIPLRYEYSDACLEALEKCGLWEPPTEGAPKGTFKHDLLAPKRHMGAVNPNARCNMSPVIPEFFAVTKSMQNVQILHGTNGVARYVVKYVVKMDKGNRCVVWADSHSGAVLRVEQEFLHNTKVTGSKINEEKAHEKSRKWRHPTGRAVSFPEVQQHILGYPEVMTNIKFVRIATKPFEQRSATKIELNASDGRVNRNGHDSSDQGQPPQWHGRGDNAPDAQSALPPCEKARRRLELPQERHMTASQIYLYGNNIKCGAYDKITQYSLRPVELLELVQSLGDYYRWFEILDEKNTEEDIYNILEEDITESVWVDGLGRVIQLRSSAVTEFREHLISLDNSMLKEHSVQLKNAILEMIESDDHNDLLVYDTDGEDLPIPVFSSITPDKPVPFILHMMLMLGKYETELDLRMQPTLRDSLAAAGLIGREFDNELECERYTNDLVRIVVEKVLAVQPVSLRRLDGYIVKAKRLFDSIIIKNEVPIYDLPPCVMTKLLDEKDKSFQKFWEELRGNMLDTIYRTMPSDLDLPSQEEVMNCTKDNPVDFDAVDKFAKSGNQSDDSYNDQKAAVEIANNLVSKYAQEFGPATTTFTKGSIVHGAPGSGKSHVILYNSLLAMARGLRVMTTALMGVRANALGGIHMHRLFGMAAKRKGNPYRLAELALDKLHRKNQLKYLHVLLTMDVLIIDECGQLSAEQLSTIDIILRHARKTDIPFGGVLILGTMDHTQLGAINGWPFLLSSHILTDFVLTKLTHSVRAYGDDDFQKVQNYTRMSPRELLSDPQHEVEFKRLVSTIFDFVPSWDSDKITPDIQRMYGRRMPAYEASCMYVSSLLRRFQSDGTDHAVSKAVNWQRTVGTRADYSNVVTDDMMGALNHALREPETLLFFRGAQFEATLNGEGYNQSQLMLMLEVPTQNAIREKHLIPLMAAPPNTTYIDLSAGIPSQEELENDGWKRVEVGHAPEAPVTSRGAEGCREQYSLRHIGSSTINKQLGNTIKGKCAMECSSDCSPFCKEQVVVGLSRTCCAKDTIIVGDKKFAVNRLWELITISNQWTDYIEMLLERLSVNGSSDSTLSRYLDYADKFPYRVCDIDIPTDTSGYVYMLVSIRDFDRDYIGQTENLSRRLDEHYRGRGAEGTHDPYYHPYGLAAYICGLSHMEKVEREELEQKWKNLNRLQIQEGNWDLRTRIEQGQKVVDDYNASCQGHENEIRLIRAITDKVASRSYRTG